MDPSGWIGRRPACPGSVVNLRAGRCYSQVFDGEEDPHALERTGDRNCATQRRWAFNTAKSRREGVLASGSTKLVKTGLPPARCPWRRSASFGLGY